MAISVAEYLGQRTDVVNPLIAPQPSRTVVQCPFMDRHCFKLKQGAKPVCSVRKTDGTFYIVCKDRFCATQKKYPGTQTLMPLTSYQKSILHSVAKTIFYPGIQRDKVLTKREVAIPVVENSTYKADYVMATNSDLNLFNGPSKVVLEMQGGGETSDTKKLSNLVRNWENDPNRDNAKLREPAQIGTLETNAWRRQQEQFMVKGNIAIQSSRGAGMVFCVGSVVYDYLTRKVKNSGLKDLTGYNWTLALIGIAEDNSQPPQPGPVPLKIDNNRLLFTGYHTFVRALTDQGLPNNDLFAGEFLALNNEIVTI